MHTEGRGKRQEYRLGGLGESWSFPEVCVFCFGELSKTLESSDF